MQLTQLLGCILQRERVCVFCARRAAPCSLHARLCLQLFWYLAQV